MAKKRSAEEYDVTALDRLSKRPKKSSSKPRQSNAAITSLVSAVQPQTGDGLSRYQRQRKRKQEKKRRKLAEAAAALGSQREARLASPSQAGITQLARPPVKKWHGSERGTHLASTSQAGITQLARPPVKKWHISGPKVDATIVDSDVVLDLAALTANARQYKLDWPSINQQALVRRNSDDLQLNSLSTAQRAEYERYYRPSHALVKVKSVPQPKSTSQTQTSKPLRRGEKTVNILKPYNEPRLLSVSLHKEAGDIEATKLKFRNSLKSAARISAEGSSSTDDSSSESESDEEIEQTTEARGSYHESWAAELLASQDTEHADSVEVEPVPVTEETSTKETSAAEHDIIAKEGPTTEEQSTSEEEPTSDGESTAQQTNLSSDESEAAEQSEHQLLPTVEGFMLTADGEIVLDNTATAMNEEGADFEESGPRPQDDVDHADYDSEPVHDVRFDNAHGFKPSSDFPSLQSEQEGPEESEHHIGDEGLIPNVDATSVDDSTEYGSEVNTPAVNVFRPSNALPSADEDTENDLLDKLEEDIEAMPTTNADAEMQGTFDTDVDKQIQGRREHRVENNGYRGLKDTTSSGDESEGEHNAPRYGNRLEQAAWFTSEQHAGEKQANQNSSAHLHSTVSEENAGTSPTSAIPSKVANVGVKRVGSQRSDLEVGGSHFGSGLEPLPSSPPLYRHGYSVLVDLPDTQEIYGQIDEVAQNLFESTRPLPEGTPQASNIAGQRHKTGQNLTSLHSNMGQQCSWLGIDTDPSFRGSGISRPQDASASAQNRPSSSLPVDLDTESESDKDDVEMVEEAQASSNAQTCKTAGAIIDGGMFDSSGDEVEQDDEIEDHSLIRPPTRSTGLSALSELEKTPSLLSDTILPDTLQQAIAIANGTSSPVVPSSLKKRQMTGRTSKHFSPQKPLPPKESAKYSRAEPYKTYDKVPDRIGYVDLNSSVTSSKVGKVLRVGAGDVLLMSKNSPRPSQDTPTSSMRQHPKPSHGDRPPEDDELTPLLSSSQKKREPAKKRKKTGAISEHFITDRVDQYNTTGKKRIAGVSYAPVPSINEKTFGLIQEKIWAEPFWLIIAVTFLNKTAGRSAVPVFWKIRQKWPQPHLLARADSDELLGMIQHLGLQNQRCKRIKQIAHAWASCPPVLGKRFRILHYPNKGDGKEYKKDEVIEGDADDCSGAVELAHIPGCGRYAIDSWRIFCRDVMRGLASDYNGFNQTDGKMKDFEPEWKRVFPEDKELRACLRWMWLRDGYIWNPLTGGKRKATEEEMDNAVKGQMEFEDDTERKFAMQAAGVDVTSPEKARRGDTEETPKKLDFTPNGPSSRIRTIENTSGGSGKGSQDGTDAEKVLDSTPVPKPGRRRSRAAKVMPSLE